jgi:hypothetical protein
MHITCLLHALFLPFLVLITLLISEVEYKLQAPPCAIFLILLLCMPFPVPGPCSQAHLAIFMSRGDKIWCITCLRCKADALFIYNIKPVIQNLCTSMTNSIPVSIMQATI